MSEDSHESLADPTPSRVRGFEGLGKPGASRLAVGRDGPDTTLSRLTVGRDGPGTTLTPNFHPDRHPEGSPGPVRDHRGDSDVDRSQPSPSTRGGGVTPISPTPREPTSVPVIPLGARSSLPVLGPLPGCRLDQTP